MVAIDLDCPAVFRFPEQSSNKEMFKRCDTSKNSINRLSLSVLHHHKKLVLQLP